MKYADIEFFKDPFKWVNDRTSAHKGTRQRIKAYFMLLRKMMDETNTKDNLDSIEQLALAQNLDFDKLRKR